jgi:four helix bundle protein
MENGETEAWLDFAKDCNFIDIETYKKLYRLNEEAARLLSYMINNPGKFI